MAKEKKLSVHYGIAKALFDKTARLLSLQYRDIAVMTTGAAELELYPELKDHQANTDLSQDGKINNIFIDFNIKLYQVY